MTDTKGKGRPLTRRDVLALGGTALVAACFSDRPTEPEGQSGEGIEVEMTSSLAFEPRVAVISAGETVTWRNTSDFPHTATGDPAKAADPARVQLPEGAEAWDSGTVTPGGTFSRTFDVPGAYGYVCLPHEEFGMTGWVVVTP